MEQQKTYEPSLILIGGRSGVGKTNIVNELITVYGSEYCRPVSYTTRLQRKNENENEYKFISKEEFQEMYTQNKFVTIDQVYNHFYAMSADSIKNILKRGQIPIKEIHPQNFDKIKNIFPDTLTVYIDGISSTNDTERNSADRLFFDTVDINEFDIYINNTRSKSINELALILHNHIKTILQYKEIFPFPSQIDEINKIGYNKVAYEFTEEKRVTTHNFHIASTKFFKTSIQKYIKKNTKILEVGPGQGWLAKKIALPSQSYSTIDISTNMQSTSVSKYNYVGTIRNTNFKENNFDVIISSLADPYLFPSAILEIRRILKNNGIFIFTTPSSKWSKNVRNNKLNNKTTFLLHDESTAEVFSFTFTLQELITILEELQMKVIFSEELSLPANTLKISISPAISLAAQKENCPINEIKLLNAIICKKL